MSRLRAAEIAVADRTAVSLASARKREAAQAELPALRQSEVAAGAELQRLVIARQTLEEEERRIAAQRETAAARLGQMASDIAREEELAADARAALQRLEAEREGVLAAQAQEGAAQATAEAALAALEEEMTARETERTLLTEQIAADEAQRAALTRRIEETAERGTRLTERQTEMSRQADAIEAEKVAAPVAAEATGALRDAEAEIARAAAASEAAAAALARAQADEDSARAPKDAAETVLTKLNAERQALVELLAAMGDKRYSPVLDSVTVESGFEAALGAALGDDLIAPLDTASPSHWFALSNYGVAQALPAGTTPLAAHVTAPVALARRLAQIGVVADRETGEMLQTQLLPGQRLVSRDGGLWRWDGFRRAAGTPTAAAQRLRQRNRIAEIEGVLGAAEAELARRAAALDDAQGAVRRMAEEERAARETARRTLEVLAAARDREAELARAAAGIASRLAALAEAAERLARDVAETDSNHAQAAEALAALPDSARAREDAAALRDLLAERRAALLKRQGERDRLAREALSRRERAGAIASELDSWRGRAKAAARQHAAFLARRDDLHREIEELQRRPAEIAARRELLAETIAHSTTRRNHAADALAEGETRLAAADKEAKAADAELGLAREERVRGEGARDQTRETQDALARHIQERLDCAPEQALAKVGIAGADELPTQEDAQSRFDRLVRERDNMGPVNLVAESEAAEIEERLAGLVREREDLTGAIARLRQGIGALNREGRERLLAAFAQVNEHFTKLFVQLFGGGRAYLSLDRTEGETEGEPGDPLEAGLEIMASPPGKKLQALSLLSGGEQALTALALLFAVFLTNPAPICVLDEVDAPLDDANVDRFCQLVAEISRTAETRFLIITHHRLTMSRVDRLFGVTMAEQGVSQLVSVDLQNVEQLRKVG